MLSDRFPFLSLIPQAQLAEQMLDGDRARIQMSLTRTSSSEVKVTFTPTLDARSLHQLLQTGGRGMPFMEIGRVYSAQVDEGGRVKMLVDGKTVSSTPPVEYLLTKVYRPLCELAKRYVVDLQGLPMLDPSRESMDWNIAQYLMRCKQSGQIASVLTRTPRVRSYCLGCFTRSLGRPLPTLPDNAQVLLVQIPGGRPTERIIEGLIREPYSPSILPVAIPFRHEHFLSWPAYQRLYEAGMQAILETVYENHLTAMMLAFAEQAGNLPEA